MKNRKDEYEYEDRGYDYHGYEDRGVRRGRSELKGQFKNKYHTGYDINVYIVWGPPAGGKTTYVRNNMEPGDLVIDLDYIKSGISMKGKTAASDNLLNVALKMRDYLYNMVEYREGLECNNIWIVSCLPTKIERDNLYNRLNATEIIEIKTPMNECVQRMMGDDEREDKMLQAGIIWKWFVNYEPPLVK